MSENDWSHCSGTTQTVPYRFAFHSNYVCRCIVSEIYWDLIGRSISIPPVFCATFRRNFAAGFVCEPRYGQHWRRFWWDGQVGAAVKTTVDMSAVNVGRQCRPVCRGFDITVYELVVPLRRRVAAEASSTEVRIKTMTSRTPVVLSDVCIYTTHTHS